MDKSLVTAKAVADFSASMAASAAQLEALSSQVDAALAEIDAKLDGSSITSLLDSHTALTFAEAHGIELVDNANYKNTSNRLVSSLALKVPIICGFYEKEDVTYTYIHEFLEELRNHSRLPVISAWVWDSFSAANKSFLNDSDHSPEAKVPVLASALSGLLAQDLYTSGPDWSEITFSAETQRFIDMGPTDGYYTKLLNRALLHDAYPEWLMGAFAYAPLSESATGPS